MSEAAPPVNSRSFEIQESWIHYANVLEDFDEYDRSKSSPLGASLGSKRRNSLQKQQEARQMTPKSAESKALTPRTSKLKTIRSKSTPRTTKYDGSKTTKRDNGKSTALASPMSDKSKNVGAVNEALAAENKRLKRRLVAKGNDAKECVDEVETDVVKLNRKIKMLEIKCKEEKAQTMQMSKHVEAHHTEIAGLRRELTNSLDQVDTLTRDRESDRDRILKLTEELEGWRQGDGSPSVKELESELRQRNNELEVVLELLEAKVQKIIELEIQLHETNEKLRMARYTSTERSGYDEPQSTSSLWAELRESKAECKKLKRHNLMLMLLFEEQEDSRNGDGGDLDSVFQQVASDYFGFSSKLGFVSKAREEGLDWSVRTDACQKTPSVDLSPVSVIPPMNNFPAVESSSSSFADELFLKGGEQKFIDAN
jgi:hypothetical protein